MSTAVQPMSTPWRARRFTVVDLDRMADAGILGEDHQRLELIDGEIIEPMPTGPKHAAVVRRILRFLQAAFGSQFITDCQQPVRLNQLTQPLPDVTVLRPRDDMYETEHPGAADVLLLVEVSDSSLEYDLGRKAAIYAAAGIAEYWVVDIEGGKLRVFRAPEGGEFHEALIVGPAETVTCRSIPTLSVNVSDWLG